ncbi:MAG: hypothetical protein WA962_01155 [Ornithinimicrobium sp.]
MNAGLQIPGLPVFDPPEGIRSAATDLVQAARAVHRTAAAVQVDWTHLAWSYRAPEQQLVLSAMNRPSERALDLLTKAEVAEAALTAYADRLAELDAERSTVILELLAFTEHRDRVEGENRDNDRGENLADLWQEEGIGLLRTEEALNRRIAYLWAAKDRAENECGNVLAELWGAPRYHRSGETSVNSQYVNGRTRDAYVALSRSGQAPWGRPAMWTEGDWTVKSQMLQDGAANTVIEGGLFAADLAGWTTDGRTEAARSGLARLGGDAATLLTTPGLLTTSAEQKAESAQRLGSAAVAATGYGTWRANGWHTAGTFIPDAVVSLATGGGSIVPRAGIRGVLSARGIPPGVTLDPKGLIPLARSRASERATEARVQLATLLQTHRSGHASTSGATPALAAPHGLPQQTPPESLTRLHNVAEDPGWQATVGSSTPGTSPRTDRIPPVAWQENFDPQTLRDSYSAEVVQATLPMIARARAVEPDITADFLAALPDDARPHGLEHRIKSPDSLASKIDRKAEHLPPGSSGPPITDVLRYTAVTDSQNDLITTAASIVDELGESGWRVRSAHHSYVDGNPYKGIHCTVRSDELGMSVEVQFHTDSSLAVKERTHGAYEVSRDPRAPMAERMTADAWLRDQSAALPNPPGLDSLDKLGGAEVRRIVYRSDRT